MRCIAIIPARSGSKGIKDKNIKELCGKPLMVYTIEAALQCPYIDCVMVSTDSLDYAKIAEQHGAQVPFLRSEELATDWAKSIDVIYEVLNKYEKLGEVFDTVVLLQPTSPLRTVRHLNEAFEMLEKRKADSIVSVCECEHNPLLSNVLEEDLCLSGFIGQFNNVRRQELRTYYRLNGAIYISKVAELRENGGFYGEKSFAYVMRTEESVDIDSEIDFKFASVLMEEKNE